VDNVLDQISGGPSSVVSSPHPSRFVVASGPELVNTFEQLAQWQFERAGESTQDRKVWREFAALDLLELAEIEPGRRGEARPIEATLLSELLDAFAERSQVSLGVVHTLHGATTRKRTAPAITNA
jgi:hypothetical protein